MAASKLRVAWVVPQYGPEVGGGSETLCRALAELLAGDIECTVLTTRARDSEPWADAYPEGERVENGVRVIRFPASQAPPDELRAHYDEAHAAPEDAERGRRWLEAHGPRAPGLVAHLREHVDDYDVVCAIPYVFATTLAALEAYPGRKLLVPCAHPEPAFGLELYRRVFDLPDTLVFNTEEERELAQHRFGLGDRPCPVIGFPLGPAPEVDADAFRTRHGIEGPYVVCVGRVDVSKGSDLLFELHRSAVARGLDVTLVLLGKAFVEVPDLPALHVAGFVDERTKHEAIAGSAAVVLPSPYESLSIVALEAWAHGRPVLANRNSAVLAGQVTRSGGGVLYRDEHEYATMLRLLLDDPQLGVRLGQAGLAWTGAWYARDHICKAWLEVFATVAREATEPGSVGSRAPLDEEPTVRTTVADGSQRGTEHRAPAAEAPALESPMERLGRALAWPIRRILNPRFSGLATQIDAKQVDLFDRLNTLREESLRLNHERGVEQQRLEASITAQRENVAEVTRLIEAQLEADVEATTVIGRSLADLRHDAEELRSLSLELGQQLSESRGAIEKQLEKSSVELQHRLGFLVDGVEGARVEALGNGDAALLNFAGSHLGFAAQRHLWINQPVSLRYTPGDVEAVSVNERVAEIPYVLQATARLGRGARVLDFGAAESLLSLHLATLGYRVTALDLRLYPYSHPNLQAVARPIEEWGTHERFDAAIAVSTIEHVGLGAYGERAGSDRLDLVAMERLREVVQPGGLLVLTTRYGEAAVGATERTYDRAGVEALLEGWSIEDLTVVNQIDQRTWSIAGDDETAGEAAVVLVTATRL